MNRPGWTGDGVKEHEFLASLYAAGMVFIGQWVRNSGRPVCSHLTLDIRVRIQPDCPFERMREGIPGK